MVEKQTPSEASAVSSSHIGGVLDMIMGQLNVDRTVTYFKITRENNAAIAEEQ
jgi:hypothetical protein